MSSITEPGDDVQTVAAPLLPAATTTERVRASGTFLWAGSEKLWVRGITYGTFRPGPHRDYPDPLVVTRDFRAMAAYGFNAVRTYTPPPGWLLDVAAAHGLRVMIGLPWEQHVAFLDERSRARSIEERVRASVAAAAGHPAVLCWAIGNEIPSPIVRWHGRRRIERYLERLWKAARAEDPGALVTYVNYPTTEYLELPFLDLACFNVYLEDRARLEAYLARLQNLAGERPVLMGEIGLDSRRNGVMTQARVLEWQVRTAFAAGCAGVFVFAWTDEWHRGGWDVEDWDFGLTDRTRRPKPALAAVRRAMEEAPLPKDDRWPRISVVVCTYNGARTIADCLEGLLRLNYPDFEVIVVNDGSTDETASIVQRYGFRCVSTPNRGLANARNTGLQLATGEIVAYTDDDARPDPDWLTYLAWAFKTTGHVGIGGPNLPPGGDGPIAECVANAPGGPMHVLVSDTEAEHVPGCNMAFRRDALEAIGGFDPQFRTAGDDVDVCWRLQERGGTLGFHRAAVVWHHRRNSLRTYWRQQRGYGRAEAMLARKWPDKYNGVGHLTWAGRLYGRGRTHVLGWRPSRIYQGTWGAAAYQRLYEPPQDGLGALLHMPESYAIIALAALLAVLGAFLWQPLFWLTFPPVAVGVTALAVQAAVSALLGVYPDARSRRARLARQALAALLHLVQPLARLSGRIRHGLTPWRHLPRPSAPLPGSAAIWSETWKSATRRLEEVEAALRDTEARVGRGGDFDDWDLEVQGGLLGSARLLLAVEEHGGGRQLARFRWWPRVAPSGLLLAAAFGLLSVAAGATGAVSAAVVLGILTLAIAATLLIECGAACGALGETLGRLAIARLGPHVRSRNTAAHGPDQEAA